jgi:hypothetical protein
MKKKNVREFKKLFIRMTKLSEKMEKRLAEINTKPVFNGNISGCVIAMPGATVTQQPTPPTEVKAPAEGLHTEEVAVERLVAGVDEVREYFWCPSAIAVIFCVCRDCYHYPNNMSQFERDFHCSVGLLANTFRHNPYMRMHIDRWRQNGAKARVLKLMEAYRKVISLADGADDADLLVAI